MVFQGKSEDLNASTANGKKLAPGPYRATKLWNSIVKNFRDEMQCKKHRRHLKMYNSCFTASEAIDFLQELLKNNPNIGKDVTRLQTIQLLRKFLKNHVIEDVQGRWGSENFEDDGRLYRFPPGVSTAQALRQPFGPIDDNVQKTLPKKIAKKQKRSKTRGPMEAENGNCSQDEKKKESETEKTSTIKSSSSTSTTSWEHLKRPLPPIPAIPKCRVVSQKVTEEDVNGIWKKVLLSKLQESLQLDTLEEIMAESEISGKDIRHNATRIGKSGVVQVEKDEDIPYWALSAMTCLANWPNSTDTGLPCYPGFEKDVFNAICEYYCGLNPVSLNDYGSARRRQTTERRPRAVLQLEPLLTYGHYELFTNIVCLIQPTSEKLAIEALRCALLILPPTNRRKLHLLLRLMSKMCTNPHLTRIGGPVCTRTLLLQTFSKNILSCNEEVYLDELLAMRLVSFLIDHQAEIMKVPTGIEKSVEERLAHMRRPDIRYDGVCEEIPYMHYVLAARQEGKVRLRNKPHLYRSDRAKRKSADIMRSWDRLVTSIKSKPIGQTSSSSTDSSDSESYVKMRSSARFSPPEYDRTEFERRFRPRTRTVGNRYCLSSSPEESNRVYQVPFGIIDLNESRIKPAKSCSDICDIKTSSSTNKINAKTSELGSSWNLRLRPRFGKPFGKLRKLKV